MRKIASLLALAVIAAATSVPSAGAEAPTSCPGEHGTPSYTGTGTFHESMEGAYVLVPFRVPSGMTRLRVKLCHDQPPLRPPSGSAVDIKHVLDLGMYEPRGGDLEWDREEFRGWGGSSRLNVLLTPEGSPEGGPTTVGFLPGPITPGKWAAEIGIAAVAGRLEGDPDGVAWRVEVFWENVESDTDDPWKPAEYDPRPARRAPGWYKGDLHVHAIHSNPNDATMREVFDYAFAPRPQGAALDFVTLSDYVTTRHWKEIGRFQPDYPRKLIVRSAEVITYRGHLNNHSSLRWIDYRTGPLYELRHGRLVLIREPQPPRELFREIRGAGGWTQVNHPTIFPSVVPLFDTLCRGCPWDYSDQETDWSLVDAFELQTGPSGLHDPDGHEPGPNPFTPLAIEWYDRLRRQGYDITAVGASDSHKAHAESLTTSPIGEPTTVVYAEELSERGVRDAVRAGRAYVKFFSSDGPDLRFTAQPVGGGPTVMMGDTLTATAATLRARVFGVPLPSEPRVLVVLRDGVPLLEFPVVLPDQEFSFPAALPGDYRLQLQRGSAIEALSNPITLRNP